LEQIAKEAFLLEGFHNTGLFLERMQTKLDKRLFNRLEGYLRVIVKPHQQQSRIKKHSKVLNILKTGDKYG